MSPRFETWRNCLDQLGEGEAEFQKWLFIHIAGVLFGGKGGELLVLRTGNAGLSVDRQIACIEALAALWRYSHVVLLRRRTGCARVVVYYPSHVQKALSEVPGPAFEQMRYPCAVGPEEFLEEVGRRWRGKEEMPHEIGLALGYPVKDVLGFIGLVPLRHSGMCGWRIYGDPGPSLQAWQRYRRARARAAAFLDSGAKAVGSP